MEREVIISPIFGSVRDVKKGTIVIDNNGLRVYGKSHQYVDSDKFYMELISQCVNMDEWKHGQYLDWDEILENGSESNSKAVKIIRDKIQSREEEIRKLRDCITMMECF